MPLLPEIYTRAECDRCGPHWWQHQDYEPFELDALPLFPSHTHARDELEYHFGWLVTDEQMLCPACQRIQGAEPTLSLAEDTAFARLVAEVPIPSDVDQ